MAPDISLNRREKIVSLAILMIFVVSAFQHTGNFREDWPFSFFGMYRGLMSSERVERVDMDYVDPDGETFSLFTRENGNYLTDDLLETLTGRKRIKTNLVIQESRGLKVDAAAILRLRDRVQSDAPSILARYGLRDPNARVRIRYRYWESFQPDRRRLPDKDVIVYEIPLSELTRGKP